MKPNLNNLPRWRGFNLLYFFHAGCDCTPLEEDFRWISEWGFNFVRIPMCYLLWTDEADVYRVKEKTLARLDETVEFGRKYGLHVNLNFHHAPGYCVNKGREEPFNLWKDKAALDAFCFHWRMFAKRYRGIPSSQLSFDLVNEPPAPSEKGMTRDDNARVVRAAVAAIYQVDPSRLVVADGLSWGNDPMPEIADLGIGQSCRGYLPMEISHYQAPWVAGEKFPAPSWPSGSGDQRWDRDRLRKHFAAWAALLSQGVGVHCGECGCFNKTPHDIFLNWFGDLLSVLDEYGIGYALWNFRGTFGVLDSSRNDVSYENWQGHSLDRRLLGLLQRH